MTRAILFSISLILQTLFLSAQNNEEEKTGFDPSKIVVGGNIGVNTNNGLLNIILSPQVSYPVLKKLYVGAGPNLSYVKDLSTSYNTINYGANVFSRLLITNDIYAQAESELLNYQTGTNSDGSIVRNWTNSVLLGAGYNKSIGNGLNASLTFLYIVNYKSGASPYTNPIVLRAGINKSF